MKWEVCVSLGASPQIPLFFFLSRFRFSCPSVEVKQTMEKVFVLCSFVTLLCATLACAEMIEANPKLLQKLIEEEKPFVLFL
jgi:hypothetical protein